MLYHVYIIESQANGAWYYDFTENIVQRFADHSSNRSKFTRFKGPWTLVIVAGKVLIKLGGSRRSLIKLSRILFIRLIFVVFGEVI